jgi:hypothetical protein
MMRSLTGPRRRGGRDRPAAWANGGVPYYSNFVWTEVTIRRCTGVVTAGVQVRGTGFKETLG